MSFEDSSSLRESEEQATQHCDIVHVNQSYMYCSPAKEGPCMNVRPTPVLPQVPVEI